MSKEFLLPGPVLSRISINVEEILRAYPLDGPGRTSKERGELRDTRRRRIEQEITNDQEQAFALRLEELDALAMENKSALWDTRNSDRKRVWLAVSDGLKAFYPKGETPLSKGGTSEVWECDSRFSNQTVVVKRLQGQQFDRQQLSALAWWELRTVIKIPHPNIVRIFDVGTLHDGDKLVPYVAMERLYGMTLFDWITKRLKENKNVLSHNEQLQSVMVLSTIANAVQYCHEHHVLHRDIHPNNAFCTGSHPSREGTKLIDFGVPDASVTTLHFRTIGYIDPRPQAPNETFESAKLRDIYSLGATLFFCVLGQHPPTLDNETTRTETLRLATSKIQDPDVRAIVSKAMRLDPADTYNSAAEMHEDLEAWLKDEEIPHLNKRYRWWDKFLLLHRRCWKRNDLRDHSRFVGLVAIAEAIILLVDSVCYSSFVLAGFPISDVIFHSLTWTNTLSLFLFLTAIAAVRARSATLRIMVPVIAYLMALTSTVAMFTPLDRLVSPQIEEFNKATTFGLSLLGLFNITQAYTTRRWSFLRFTGWAFIILAPFSRFLSDLPSFKNFTPVLLFLSEALSCIMFAVYQFSKADDSIKG